VVLLEHLEHADVRGAARPPPREHQPDAGTARLTLARGVLRGRTELKTRANVRRMAANQGCISRFLVTAPPWQG
jgi:hypothetical protein